jgi:hypothetical protein
MTSSRSYFGDNPEKVPVFYESVFLPFIRGFMLSYCSISFDEIGCKIKGL